ncbi:MAG: sigma-70 family RNA polymerase sigma factor [Planctomycetota bacterium]
MDEVEREVIERSRRGDKDAFRLLVEKYQRPIIATVYRLVGSRFHQDLEDIAQDILVKIHKSLDKFDFDRGTKFSTWLFTFVRNHCFDVLKKRRLSTHSLGASDDAAARLPSGVAAPDGDLLNDELSLEIERAIFRLPEEQRTAFILREYQALGYAEIAEIMQCSEGTVKSRLYRAKEALRERLAPYLNR